MGYPRFLLAIVLVAIPIGLLTGCSTGGRYYYNHFEDNRYDDPEPPITSENWNCTEDCSGHEAGYEWAAEKGIDDLDNCGGNSDSFVEGCQAYVNESSREKEAEREEYERENSYFEY